MFNLKRLFGRKEQLSDAETAYIEGRASEAEAEQVRRRVAASPERLADLESLRATVNVLRSVQSEMAPRSFALAEAPAYARSSSRRAGFAPAMAAIVAMIGVGLLAAGDLAGVVDQSSSGSDSDATSLTAWDISGAEGPPGPAGPADREREDDAVLGTSMPAVPSATTTTGAAATPTSAAAESLAPDSGYGMSQEQYELLLRATATAEAAESTRDAELQTVESDSREPAPSAGQTAESDSSETLAATDGDAITLPLWQLQASLAGLAALMIAAWAFIRRRATA